MTVAEPSSVRPDAMGERRGAKLVVDMLNDFVTGKFKNPRAEGIVPDIAELLREARHDKDWIVVFSNDAHLPQDFELKVWGEHAMAGIVDERVSAGGRGPGDAWLRAPAIGQRCSR